ncbi:hypothetical protein [Aliagarivorans marinus]|uniref:hypothetical protein n=1 Tax=Aliagarivorans marinus TaxID=561965 RepID=UPI000408994E|nr:hypothetical protein [Aliagarivorans marinus]
MKRLIILFGMISFGAEASSLTLELSEVTKGILTSHCKTLEDEATKACTNLDSLANNTLSIDCKIDTTQTQSLDTSEAQSLISVIDTANRRAAHRLAECVNLAEVKSEIASEKGELYRELLSLAEGKTVHTSKWISTFEIGYQLGVGYDKDGKSTGLTESSPTANLRINGRWTPATIFRSINTEVGVAFGSASTTTGATEEGGSDSEGNQMPSGFNDVSDTVDFGFKAVFVPSGIWSKWLASDNLDSSLGISTVVGFRSREEATDGNELTHYLGAGFEYNYYGRDLSRHSPTKNALPKGRLSVLYLKAEEWGAREDADVLSLRGFYQIVEGRPFLLGFHAEFGPGESDDYSIRFSVRQETSKLLDFFGLTG